MDVQTTTENTHASQPGLGQVEILVIITCVAIGIILGALFVVWDHQDRKKREHEKMKTEAAAYDWLTRETLAYQDDNDGIQ